MDAADLGAIAAHLREAVADRVNHLDSVQLEAAIQAAAVEAGRFGFADPAEIAEFVVLGLQFGEGFAERPWAKELLTDPDLDAEFRLHLLRHAAVLYELAESD